MKEEDELIWDEDSNLSSLEVSEEFFEDTSKDQEDLEEVVEETTEEEETEEVEETEEEVSEEVSEEEEVNEEEDEEVDEVFKNAFEVFDPLFQYLPEDFKPEYTEEGIEKGIEAVKSTIFDEVHQGYLNNLQKNEKASNYLDFLIKTEGEGDVDAWMKINIAKDYSESDLESNTSLQKEVVTQLYESQNWDKDDIAAKLEDLEDLDLLGKEAKMALKYTTKNKEKMNEQLVEKAANTKEEQKAIYDNNKSILNDSFDKIGLDSKRKEQVIDAIMTPLELENGGQITMLDYKLAQIKNNPEDIIKLTNLVLAYEQGKGLNIGKIADRVATTKQTRNLRQKLEQMENSSTVSKSKSGRSKNKKNGLDLSELTLI